MSDLRCDGCAFYDNTDSRSGNFGWCRRCPPRFFADLIGVTTSVDHDFGEEKRFAVATENLQTACWPAVRESDWCGEHSVLHEEVFVEDDEEVDIAGNDEILGTIFRDKNGCKLFEKTEGELYSYHKGDTVSISPKDYKVIDVSINKIMKRQVVVVEEINNA